MPLDLFSKTPLPKNLPPEMQAAVNELKKSANRGECLKKAYDILTTKYRGCRFFTLSHFFDLFERDLEKLWSKNGCLHCNNINYILRTLLVASNWFTDNDIRARWTLIWYFSPHQYLQVKVNDEWINIDIWARNHGIKFGDYAHGFH